MQGVLAVEDRFGCESRCTCSCAAGRISALDKIVRDVAEQDPMYASETDGSHFCFFCGHSFIRDNDAHAPGCTWLEARRLLGLAEQKRATG